MADKKITELDVSQTVAADDSVFANVNGSARQVAVSLILALLEDVYAPLESPALEGTPTAPTPADTDDSTRIATTAFLKSVLEDYAKLASPTFTGTPKTSTPTSTDDSTRIPTTAWVKDRIAEAGTGGGSGDSGGTFIIDITGCTAKPEYSEVWSNITSGLVPVLYNGSNYSYAVATKYLNPGVRIWYYAVSACANPLLTYVDFN